MKVILKQDHDFLGDQGQIIEVKNGYARNYLIPKGIVTMANKSNLKSLEEITRQRKSKTDKIAADSNRLSEALSSQSVEFKVNAGEDNKLFGSVTSQMIHDLLTERGFTTIERKKILLKDPIKDLGEYEVEIKLPQSVIAKIKVNVIKDSIEPEIKAVEKDEKKVEENSAAEAEEMIETSTEITTEEKSKTESE